MEHTDGEGADTHAETHTRAHTDVHCSTNGENYTALLPLGSNLSGAAAGGQTHRHKASWEKVHEAMVLRCDWQVYLLYCHDRQKRYISNEDTVCTDCKSYLNINTFLIPRV